MAGNSLGEREKSVHLQRLAFWRTGATTLRFNRGTKEAPHRWERQAGSCRKPCCHGWKLSLTCCKPGGCWGGSLPTAKGLTNAEIQSVKHSYTLKVISYIQMMWTVVRGGILSLPDQENTLWKLNTYRGYRSDLYQLKTAVITPQKKATAWEQWSILGSGVGRGAHSSEARCTASGVRGGAQEQAQRQTVLYIASEHLNLPCSECKVSPCKPSPFHAPAQWAAYTSLILSPEWHRATLA